MPFKWEHVKGHQDAVRKWYELTRMETLNVRADYHATTALQANTTPPKHIHMIPSSKIALRIRDIDITSHYATHLRKAATRPALEKRFHKHYGWTPAQVDHVDWKAHQGTFSKLRFAEKKFVLKFIHQSPPMGKIFHKIDPSQPITCSSCQKNPTPTSAGALLAEWRWKTHSSATLCKAFFKSKLLAPDSPAPF